MKSRLFTLLLCAGLTQGAVAADPPRKVVPAVDLAPVPPIQKTTSGSKQIEALLHSPARLELGERKSVTIGEVLDMLHAQHQLSIRFDIPTLSSMMGAHSDSPGILSAPAPTPTARSGRAGQMLPGVVTNRSVVVGGQKLPPAYYMNDDLQFYPATAAARPVPACAAPAPAIGAQNAPTCAAPTVAGQVFVYTASGPAPVCAAPAAARAPVYAPAPAGASSIPVAYTPAPTAAPAVAAAPIAAPVAAPAASAPRPVPAPTAAGPVPVYADPATLARPATAPAAASAPPRTIAPTVDSDEPQPTPDASPTVEPEPPQELDAPMPVPKPPKATPVDAKAPNFQEILADLLKVEIDVQNLNLSRISIDTLLRHALEAAPNMMIEEFGGMPLLLTKATLLDYVVEEDGVVITTRLRALGTKETRVYSIKQLSGLPAEQLVKTIRQSIRPWSWRAQIDDLGNQLKGTPLPAETIASMLSTAVQLVGGEFGVSVSPGQTEPAQSEAKKTSLDEARQMQLVGNAMVNGLVTFVQATVLGLEMVHHAEPPTGTIQTLGTKLVITQSQAAHREIADLLRQLAEE